MGSYLEFIFSNSPIYFLEILFILFFLLDFFEARSKESIDGAADWFDNSPYFWSSKKKKNQQNFVKKREFRKSRIFGGSDATNMLYITYYWATSYQNPMIAYIEALDWIWCLQKEIWKEKNLLYWNSFFSYFLVLVYLEDISNRRPPVKKWV